MSEHASTPIGPLDDMSRDAAVGALRLSMWLRRVGLSSAWRFLPGESEVLGLTRVLLDGGGVAAEVGFPAEDLAVAAADDEALAELARQAAAAWRRQSILGSPG